MVKKARLHYAYLKRNTENFNLESEKNMPLNKELIRLALTRRSCRKELMRKAMELILLQNI